MSEARFPTSTRRYGVVEQDQTIDILIRWDEGPDAAGSRAERRDRGRIA
ncbi:MAG: hypothetical protein ACJ8EK_00535 [Bradyrhizobium sp.]